MEACGGPVGLMLRGREPWALEARLSTFGPWWQRFDNKANDAREKAHQGVTKRPGQAVIKNLQGMNFLDKFRREFVAGAGPDGEEVQEIRHGILHTGMASL